MMENKQIYLKNNILEILNNSKYPVSSDEIVRLLEINSTDDKNGLLLSLEELKKSKIIFATMYNKYYLKNKNYYIGRFSLNKKGFGFVKCNDEKSFYVHKKNNNSAFNNDEVLFVVTDFTKPTGEVITEAKVIRVLKRNLDILIGVVKVSKKTHQKYLVIKNVSQLNKTANIVNPDEVVEGNVVSAKLSKVVDNKNVSYIYVKIEKVLGHVNDPGIDILSIINEFNIPSKFDAATYEQASKVPTVIKESELSKFTNRKDLTNDLLVTIDGVTAKDLDDAIRVKKLANGNYSLIVAIADVSNYVQQGTPMDITALERGASAYLIDRVIPMLPERLSNGICSLNPEEYRLCLVADMEIAPDGKTVKSSIYQAIMKSKMKLTYDIVNQLFKTKKADEIADNIQKMLFEAYDLYKILAKYKKTAGMIVLDLKEPEFVLDDKNKVVDIKIRERDDAEKLIESFMIRANEVVANTMAMKKIPFIYRIHPKPKAEKLRLLWNQLTLFGIDLRQWSGEINPKSFQQIIEKLSTSENNQLTLTIFLRSMEKAIYSQKNEGHFGLVSEFYSHFTSPIRRYPDLLAHRIIKEFIINKNYDKKTFEYYNQNIQMMADKSTANEIKIVDCEREVHKMKKAEYMEQFVGKEFDGIISGITGFGCFVVLNNTIEGLVHISDLDDDHYIYEDRAFKLIGERTKKIYSIGQKVRIRVKAASKETRNIDFLIIT